MLARLLRDIERGALSGFDYAVAAIAFALIAALVFGGARKLGLW